MAMAPDEIKKELGDPIPVHFHKGDPEPRLTPLALRDLEVLHTNALAYIKVLESDVEKLMSMLHDAERANAKRVAKELDEIINGQRWISVEERLPEGEVLAANFAPGTYGYKEYIIGYVSAVKCTEPDWYRGKCYATNDHEILNDVTHWMPLPEPPEESP